MKKNELNDNSTHSKCRPENWTLILNFQVTEAEVDLL